MATPLLVSSALQSSHLSLAGVRFLVLDEGDRLLDEQFVQQVDTVIAACTSPHLVTIFFFPPAVSFSCVLFLARCTSASFDSSSVSLQQRLHLTHRSKLCQVPN